MAEKNRLEGWKMMTAEDYYHTYHTFVSSMAEILRITWDGKIEQLSDE